MKAIKSRNHSSDLELNWKVHLRKIRFEFVCTESKDLIRRLSKWLATFCTVFTVSFVYYCLAKLIVLLFLSTVVNCALRFYNSSTVISGRKDQPAVKKQVTKTLNVTTNPEEKRKIIGDTFMKVTHFAVRSSATPNLNLVSGLHTKRNYSYYFFVLKQKRFEAKLWRRNSFRFCMSMDVMSKKLFSWLKTWLPLWLWRLLPTRN